MAWNPNMAMDTDGKRKADYVKKLHQKVRENIEKRTEENMRKANKGRRQIVFEPGDWAWVHMRKERFPAQRRSKLLPRGDGPFQVLQCINENSYKLDLPGEYNISASFNVSDLSPFDVGFDLGTNRFEERGNDANQLVDLANTKQDSLELSIRPITRARAKRFRESLSALVEQAWEKATKELGEPTRSVFNLLEA
ncbi:uncharacterized protein [Gossypium hirsutum]|uniref:Tf2-1-like SH3-like domain-containing protein n=1 Tax=Gossypium hirsutum TaxID=3635 RepID=A0A1U8JW67_GOSHI|nr:uncharacterized protein LOC107911148 [Gossypium hirsutum]